MHHFGAHWIMGTETGSDPRSGPHTIMWLLKPKKDFEFKLHTFFSTKKPTHFIIIGILPSVKLHVHVPVI